MLSFALLGVLQIRGFLYRKLQRRDGAIRSRFCRSRCRSASAFIRSRSLSYEIDVYRGDVAAQHNFIDFAAYVAMFPQLIAGPIVRYRDIAPAAEGADTLARSRGLGRFALRGRSREEGAALRTSLRSSSPRIRLLPSRSALYAWLYADRLHAADLFRFLRLQRYGHRAGAASSASRSRKTFDYPYIAEQHHGVLAALAHVARHMVPGLSLYPARRQPLRPAARQHSATSSSSGWPRACGTARRGILFSGDYSMRCC